MDVVKKNIAEGMAEQTVNALEKWVKKKGLLSSDKEHAGMGAPKVVISQQQAT